MTWDRLDAIGAVFAHKAWSASERLVVLALVFHADKAGACFPSFDRLARETNIGRRTLARMIPRLDGTAFRVARTRGTANRYDLTILTSATSGTTQRSPPKARPVPPDGTAQTGSTGPPDQCHHGTSDTMAPVPLATGTSAILAAPRNKDPSLNLIPEVIQEVTQMDLVWNRWVEKLWAPHYTRAPKRTPDRVNKIKARLKDGYSVEDLCRAIDAVSENAWNMGQNPRERAYIELDLIFRTASKVDGWLAKKVRQVAPHRDPTPKQPAHGAKGYANARII